MQISFILVEPAVPENIGASARALKTMGFSSLYLVNPCDHLSGPARWLAHASGEILENARIFNSLEQALGEFDFVIGTTAKRRSVKVDYYPLDQIPSFLNKKQNVIQNLAVVFGREESGLTNHELALCDMVSNVPLKTTYPSLNLSQAVMLYAWELSKVDIPEPVMQSEPANSTSLRALKDKMQLVLSDVGFDPQSNIYPRFLERIQFLTEDDVHLLHSFCNKFLKK